MPKTVNRVGNTTIYTMENKGKPQPTKTPPPPKTTPKPKPNGDPGWPSKVPGHPSGPGRKVNPPKP